MLTTLDLTTFERSCAIDREAVIKAVSRSVTLEERVKKLVLKGLNPRE